MTLRRNTPPARVEAQPRHVIAEYKHRTQSVICECGWSGSTASPLGERSAWQEHLQAMRPPGRG
jgi:hypothetical protein